MNASYGQLPPITEGELIDIHLRRARVLTVSGDRRYMQVETPTGYRLLIDRTRLDIDRVASKEWPPQPGDVWADRKDDEWFAVGGPGRMIDHQGGGWSDADEVAQEFGPMRLLRRRGWTPPDPAEEKPVEPDKRTATIAGLRDMADFLEANDDLPESYGWNGQLAPESEQHLRDMAEHFGSPIRTDNDKMIAADIVRGPVSLTLYLAKPKPAPAAPVVDDQPITTERIEIGADGCGCPITAEMTVVDGMLHSGVDGTEQTEHRPGCWNVPTGKAGLEPREDHALVDDGDAEPELATCTAWLVNGAGHTHACALDNLAGPRGIEMHEGDHVCVEDACGQGWSEDYFGPALPADLGQHDETDVSDRGIL